MSDYIITTENLTKKYGPHNAADHVNMHIKKGAIYGFIGKNGAGKTTCLKMITGLSHPTEGTVTLFGKSGKDLDFTRSRIGCLIEAPGLYPNMSAYNNLKAKAILLGHNNPDYINEILETVGLKDTGKKKVKYFSVGMKQRLGIGLALVGSPDILILDEPVNGLDPQGILEVRETLLKLNSTKNITIIISSHILEELSKIATHYGFINNGQLIQEISREQLNELCSERISITLDEPKLALPILDSMGIRNYQLVSKNCIHVYERMNDIQLINRQLIQADVPIQEIRITHQELEAYFLQLTGGAQNA